MSNRNHHQQEQQEGAALKFRSVLPHEPLPTCEEFGFVHLQGAFEPKTTNKKKSKQGDDECHNKDDYYWTNKDGLKSALMQSLCSTDGYHQTNLNLPHAAISIDVLDAAAPFTKVRLKYQNQQQAQEIAMAWRKLKITPNQLFVPWQQQQQQQQQQQEDNANKFGSHTCQVTAITTIPLPQNSWTRSNPPKFRRLLHDKADQEERSTTRFLFVTGLLEDVPSYKEKEATEGNDSVKTTQSFWKNPLVVLSSIRKVFNKYDKSGNGIEIFLPRNKNQPLPLTCHVGMRSSGDVQFAIQNLQGQTVKWEFEDNHISSGVLFLDYASVTQKSLKKSIARSQGGGGGGGGGEDEKYRGEPSRPECTSTTDHIEIPGLVVIENFVSQAEEDILMATLTGPQAPWAPDQTNMSQTGAVKRLVQHYGYVFDYQTADVLRDRTKEGANCPPMPAMNVHKNSVGHDFDDDEGKQVSTMIDKFVQNGLGWDVLAGIIERTRKHKFATNKKESTTTIATNDNNDNTQVPSPSTSSTIVSYPHLNQLSVNHYKPGEGIGSHVDTPSAFGDGLISLSLNSGIVMEFRKVDKKDDDDTPSSHDKNGDKGATTTIKKLVYLPARSLVLMSGDARYKWEHMIVTRRTDTVDGIVIPRKLRVSLTMRTSLGLDGMTPLELVESRGFPPTWGTTDNENAMITPKTEREHVHAVYDAIATQWHHTRGKRGVLWPGARQFLQCLPPGSIVADVGCGDGKYFPAILEAGSYVIGTDISMPLLQTAFGSNNNNELQDEKIADTCRVSTRHRQSLRDRPAVAVADCMSVPIRSDSCDAAICIAVMHHLSTLERRIRCIEELVRIVQDGGTINIQAWALDQAENSKRRFVSTDVFVPFNAQPKYLEKSSAEAEDERDDGPAAKQVGSLPPFNSETSTANETKSIAEMYSEKYTKADFDEKKGLVVFQRYCHMYRDGELEEIVKQVQGAILLESGYEKGNYFVILKVRKC